MILAKKKWEHGKMILTTNNNKWKKLLWKKIKKSLEVRVKLKVKAEVEVEVEKEVEADLKVEIKVEVIVGKENTVMINI